MGDLLFNLFFKEAEKLYFQGEAVIIPFLPLNRIRKEKDKFKIIGRILEHMLLLIGNIPAKLSKLDLMLIANPQLEVEREEFYLFVDPCERNILKKAKRDFIGSNDKEKAVLSNIFSTY